MQTSVSAMRGSALVATTHTARTSTRATRCVAAFDARRWASVAGVGLASIGLTLTANAATVKLGTDSGGLQFDPETVTISKGDSVTWQNNAGFPHNIVFDEDGVPSGVNVSSLNHEDYLNAPGQSVTSKFDVAGEYNYYCEPHQGAGMQGKVIVN
ncbi:PCY1 [Auxenochlorella protothecoides x Auxenochlorella symbiontica]|uniref:Plastocyanin n=2 Tax=Auxenochlorella protothecoides TaxID=3075 RepID=A0A087SFC6_AUXPR|nr:Plastocyanin, chloroplastic [Auxenochlorella protothecoides]KFM24430.1 Plastocyanin, chloroplastic [Auxenochlorella protothecoides]RMZ54404.1 hypothetical protein APUTEX25_001980 [Auxenochlorella protothecoides]|eukprot:RMZ54404.1 hypothetical protein APUTEX25_001980 [Auxenochlorella protothecoides]